LLDELVLFEAGVEAVAQGGELGFVGEVAGAEEFEVLDLLVELEEGLLLGGVLVVYMHTGL
jgi:hypothetical protein